MKKLAILTACAALAACAQQRAAHIAAEYQVAVATCKKTMPPLAKGTAVMRAKCIDAAAEQYSATFYPDFDLMQVVIAERDRLATKVDDGSLSVDDYNVQIARIMSEAKSQHLERANDRARTRAMQAASGPHTTSCFNGTGFVTCTGN